MARRQIIRDARGRKVGTINPGVGFLGTLLIIGAIILVADAIAKYWPVVVLLVLAAIAAIAASKRL